MKIHAHIIAWNEEKILPFTLDHYSRFCEKIFVYDNMSTDNSELIYKKYNNVIVKKWQSPDNKYNDAILSSLKSNAYKESRNDNVDWVVVCDCDEFLYHPDMLEVLEAYKQSNVTMPKIDGHDMCSENFPEYDGELLVKKVKIGSKTYGPMCKNIIFNPVLDVTYAPGSHSNRVSGSVQSETAELKLLHYKFLGKEYVLERYKTLAEQLSDYNKQTGLSGHWTRPPLKYMDEMLAEQYQVI